MTERRVLVTGSSGFTGHYVCSELESRGFKVFGASEDLSINGSSVDLGNFDGLSRLIKDVQPTHVVHLAAIAFVGHGHIEDFHRVNVEGTENLLRSSQILLLTSKTSLWPAVQIFTVMVMRELLFMKKPLHLQLTSMLRANLTWKL